MSVDVRSEVFKRFRRRFVGTAEYVDPSQSCVLEKLVEERGDVLKVSENGLGTDVALVNKTRCLCSIEIPFIGLHPQLVLTDMFDALVGNRFKLCQLAVIEIELDGVKDIGRGHDWVLSFDHAMSLGDPLGLTKSAATVRGEPSFAYLLVLLS